MCGSRDDEGELIIGHQGEGVGGGYLLPGKKKSEILVLKVRVKVRVLMYSKFEFHTQKFRIFLELLPKF